MLASACKQFCPCDTDDRVVLQLQNLRLHFLSLTEVAPSKWAFPREKHITPQQVHKHNQAVIDSGLLSPQGPFSLIDVHRLTQGMLLLQVVSCCAASSCCQMHTSVVVVCKQLCKGCCRAAVAKYSTADPCWRV